jgi:hypothetical protein
MGPLELYLIYDEGGTWEEEWRDLQGVIALPVISKEDMDHALHGWTRPLVDQLGPPPQGMLRQLPQAARSCRHERACPFYNKRRCGLLLGKMPWCFEPAGFSGAHNLVAEVVKYWRSEVYVLLVREPAPDATA